MGTAIECSGLTKTYRGGRGVFDLNFQVAEGEIFGFLGPNGAGKTTTIRTLMGLLRPTGGSVRVFGFDSWRASPAVKAQVGFVPGELHLYDGMRGHALIEFAAGFRPEGTVMRAKQLARQFDLDLHQRIRHLSKGNRQKLVIIVALMHDPRLLIMDEPTSGLDPLMQVAVLDLLRQERERGKTVFLSTHLLPEVEKIADRVAVIRNGRLVAIEEVERLKAMRQRRMEAVFRQPVTAEAFAGLEGVRVVGKHEHDRHVELTLRGDPAPVLARLAALGVTDLIYPPADLESVFLHYYEDAAPLPAPAAQEVSA
jgi:ABC-2 type transport system ATP-binding protein